MCECLCWRGPGHLAAGIAHTFAFTLQLTPQGHWQCHWVHREK